MRIFPALLLALLSGNAAAAVTEHLEMTYYQAPAKPSQTILQVLNAASPHRPGNRIFHALTSWNVDWRFQPRALADGRCKVSRVDANLSGRTDLPRLVNATERQEEEFEPYLRALRVHEAGHVAIGREAAVALDIKLRALPPTLSCAELEQASRVIADRTLAAYSAKGLQYDAVTGHGRTQGAWLGK